MRPDIFAEDRVPRAWGEQGHWFLLQNPSEISIIFGVKYPIQRQCRNNQEGPSDGQNAESGGLVHDK